MCDCRSAAAVPFSFHGDSSVHSPEGSGGELASRDNAASFKHHCALRKDPVVAPQSCAAPCRRWRAKRQGFLGGVRTQAASRRAAPQPRHHKRSTGPA